MKCVADFINCKLCRSKLKVEDLKEVHLAMKEAQWAEDKEATHCRQCNKMFSVSRRKVSSLFVSVCCASNKLNIS